jgi:hypothetical protein
VRLVTITSINHSRHVPLPIAYQSCHHLSPLTILATVHSRPYLPHFLCLMYSPSSSRLLIPSPPVCSHCRLTHRPCCHCHHRLFMPQPPPHLCLPPPSLLSRSQLLDGLRMSPRDSPLPLAFPPSPPPRPPDPMPVCSVKPQLPPPAPSLSSAFPSQPFDLHTYAASKVFTSLPSPSYFTHPSHSPTLAAAPTSQSRTSHVS